MATMLLSHRRAGLAAAGAWVETHAVVHTSYRLHVVENRRVVCDDGLFFGAFDRRGQLGRPVLTVVLSGRARLRTPGAERWLVPGDLAVLHAKGAIEMRQEGDPFRSIALEWDPGTLGGAVPGGLSSGRLAPQDLAKLETAARNVCACGRDASRAPSAIAALLARLRASGIPLDAHEPGALVEPVAPQLVRLSRALDDVLSDLAGNPAGVDLDTALGLSARQVNRLVTTFNARFAFNAAGWRDTRNRRRLMVAAVLLTAPTATTERVTTAVGYAAPTALCHAFAQAGLPSPGSIARAVEHLL